MGYFYESCESKFVWKIENFSCLKGETFFSPPIETTSCSIVIRPENSYIFAHLTNLEKYNRFNCSFSFLDSNGTPLICKEKTIGSGECFEKDAFKFPRRAQYFPNDVLRLEFRLWDEGRGGMPMWHGVVLPIPMPMSFFACTQLEPIAKVIKKTFSCVLSALNESGFKRVKFSENICNGHNLGMEIEVPHSGQVSVHLTTELFGFCAKILVFLLDSTTGKRIEFGNHDAKFVSGKRTCQFDINVSRNMLLQHANRFLCAGTLSLIFTCTFSGQFCYDSIVEESEIFNARILTNSSIGEVSEAETNSNETGKVSDELEISRINEPDTISQAFQKMLIEGYLSDFTLKVGDRTFPVHKSVLGVRSKVFRAMFDSEMKEMQDNCMDIKDIDGDTLLRMLQFVYSDKIDEDMDSTEASSLYAAADFYALEPLKQGCSTILKDGLTITSALAVLALGDLHQDQQLKSAALDFISLYDQDILDTETWIKFEGENAKLAMETLRKLYARKMRG